MTRINLVPPVELVDKHLVAEYRELPRIFGLIEKWQERGCPGPLPDDYTLGKGHVRFFYDKADWLAHRFDQLVSEMLRRGFKPQYTTQWHRVKTIGATGQRGDLWTPRHRHLAINRARIEDRLNGR